MPDLKPSIMIVEDEDSVRTTLGEIFKVLGHRVRSASDGLEALMMMRPEVPEVLLSDLNMPGMSGFELLSVVRRRFPAVRVVAMSGAFGGSGVPCGVTADAFYEKGTGMVALLMAVGRPPFTNRLGGVAPEPIWIQRNGHDTTGAEFVTIACPECFRTFPQTISETAGLILGASCVFCHSVIHFGVIEPLDANFPLRYQPAPRFATSLMQSDQGADCRQC